MDPVTSRRNRSRIRKLLHALGVGGGSTALTVSVFLVLPLLQAITRPPNDMLVVRTVDVADLPPPPPPPEEEPEEEPEADEEPPELAEDIQPLDLSQLELALNPGVMSGDWMGGDVTVKLGGMAGVDKDVDALFSVSDLDQTPRAIYQTGPSMNAKLRRKAPGTVYVVFIVNEKGRVEQPKALKSTDPAFERAAIAAVKQWKFEPGKRQGQAVRFRMRVPITFPKS